MGVCFIFFWSLGSIWSFVHFEILRVLCRLQWHYPQKKNGWYVTLHTDPKDTLSWYFFGGRSEKLEKGKIKTQNNKQSRRKLKKRAQKNMKKAWKSQFFSKILKRKGIFEKSSNWSSFMSFWVISMVESAKSIYVDQTF